MKNRIRSRAFGFLSGLTLARSQNFSKTNGWLRSVALFFLRLLPRVAYPVICGPLKGARFILGSLAGEGGGAANYLNLIENEQTSAFADTLKRGQVVFDIGANVGYYTVLASRLVGSEGKVFAFEPLVRNVAYLYRHIVLNRLSNVTVISGACSGELSVQVFSEGRNCSEGRLGQNDGTYKTFPVLTVSVDDIVEKTGVGPDVIKIDVEGAELGVLKGAGLTLRKVKPTIFLSTHSDALRSDCLGYLKECGYACEVLSQDITNPSEFLCHHINSK